MSVDVRAGTDLPAAATLEAAGVAVGELADDLVVLVGGIAASAARRSGSDKLAAILGTQADLLGTICKGIAGLFAGTGSGAIRVGGGLARRDGRLVLHGVGDIGATVTGTLLVVLGKTTEAVQAFADIRPRPLTDDERAVLQAVFGTSVSLGVVRIVEGRCGVFEVNDRPFTLGNTIYMKQRTGLRTLVHECAHVWQNQHEGFRYTADALWAQLTVRPIPYGAYDWMAELDRGKAHWAQLNKEAQAAFLDTVYEEGRGAGDGPGAFYEHPAAPVATFVHDDRDLTALAAVTVDHVRRRRPWRLSGLLART